MEVVGVAAAATPAKERTLTESSTTHGANRHKDEVGGSRLPRNVPE